MQDLVHHVIKIRVELAQVRLSGELIPHVLQDKWPGKRFELLPPHIRLRLQELVRPRGGIAVVNAEVWERTCGGAGDTGGKRDRQAGVELVLDLNHVIPFGVVQQHAGRILFHGRDRVVEAFARETKVRQRNVESRLASKFVGQHSGVHSDGSAL